MNRREMLALMGSAVACKALRAEKAAFGRIDAHAHVHRVLPALIDNLEKDDWHLLSICVWEQFENQMPPKSDVSNFGTLEELLAATAKVHRESRGRIAWASTIDAHRFEEPDFTERSIATVRQSFKDGAVGVKIWKTVGMKIRGKDGHYLLPDDAKLQPIYEAIQRADRTLIIHIAEPNEAWAPELVGYWKNNPQWHADKEGPDKETILQSRDRLLAKNPKLRVMGCHLGSNEQDLPALAKRLDKYSNFSVDVSARVRNLFGENQDAKRDFVIKYQDRLIYGSDNAAASQPEEQAARSPVAAENREWEMFSSTGKITQGKQGKQEIQGMGLPESVLRKMFRDNALRVIPGILKA
jgi:predicted TIM-barrel fold metal-dependent hydrolase